MINGIRAKGKAQDLLSLAVGCQKGRVHMLVDGNPEKPVAYIISASMLDELLLLEAGLYGVKKSDLLKDLEEIGLRVPVVAIMNRLKIYFVRDALRYLHLDPISPNNVFGINTQGAYSLVSALKMLGADPRVFFPHSDPALGSFWLGE